MKRTTSTTAIPRSGVPSIVAWHCVFKMPEPCRCFSGRFLTSFHILGVATHRWGYACCLLCDRHAECGKVEVRDVKHRQHIDPSTLRACHCRCRRWKGPAAVLTQARAAETLEGRKRPRQTWRTMQRQAQIPPIAHCWRTISQHKVWFFSCAGMVQKQRVI